MGKKGQDDSSCLPNIFGESTSELPCSVLLLVAIYKSLRHPSLSSFNFIKQIEYYQREIDPELKRKRHVKRICKYHPTCSEYTKQAINKYGAFLGTIKGALRIMRCNPFSKGGYDPVR